MKELNLAWFTIKEYYRSTWLLTEGLAVGVTLFLASYMYWTLHGREVFLALGIFIIILAVLNTYRLTSRETNPRIFVIMTKGLKRREYLTGKAVAALLIDLLPVLLLFLMGYFMTRMKMEYPFFESIARLVPLIIALILSQAVALCFSPLVRDKRAVMISMVILILGFVQPITGLEYLLPPLQQLIKISYSPWQGLWWYYLALAVVYIVLFYGLACYFFKRRELDYEQK